MTNSIPNDTYLTLLVQVYQKVKAETQADLHKRCGMAKLPLQDASYNTIDNIYYISALLVVVKVAIVLLMSSHRWASCLIHLEYVQL